MEPLDGPCHIRRAIDLIGLIGMVNGDVITVMMVRMRLVTVMMMRMMVRMRLVTVMMMRMVVGMLMVVWEKAGAGWWAGLMHCLDVSHTFQNLSHLNPTRRCRGNLCPRIQVKAICRRWVDEWLFMPAHHDYGDEEEPDEDDGDDKGGGLGESRCRS